MFSRKGGELCPSPQITPGAMRVITIWVPGATISSDLGLKRQLDEEVLSPSSSSVLRSLASYALTVYRQRQRRTLQKVTAISSLVLASALWGGGWRLAKQLADTLIN